MLLSINIDPPRLARRSPYVAKRAYSLLFYLATTPSN